LIPASSSEPASIAFLVLRSCTQSMDTPPRSAFLAGIVRPSERTAMMGFINIIRSTMSSFSPLIIGFLAGKGLIWVALVMAGSILITYDLGILAVFGRHSKVEHSEEDGQSDGESTDDDQGKMTESKIDITEESMERSKSPTADQRETDGEKLAGDTLRSCPSTSASQKPIVENRDL